MTISGNDYNNSTNENFIEELKRKYKKKPQKSYVIDKKEIPADKNAYVFRNPYNNNRWYLYYYDRPADKRYRLVLTDPSTGKHPPTTTKGQEEAWMLGIAKFVELKGKSDRGESISTCSFGDLCKMFLRKEAARVSDVPHRGITKARYRLIKSQVKWARDFMNNDSIAVHKIRRTKFDSYEIWRKEKAREYGKRTPTAQTIVSELSTIGRMFKEVAVRRGFLTIATMPEISWKRPPKRKVSRRDDLTEKEWLQIESSSRYYFIKGRTRILDENYKMEKSKNGTWKTRTTVTRHTPRGAANLDHRNMFYWAMRIAMDSGMRIGSIKKLKWKHIDENAALPAEQKKTWCCIDVPAENTKTGIAYRCTAPIVKHLNNIRKFTKFKRPNDLVFTNQYFKEPKRWSTRLWEDYLKEVLVEARLANFTEDTRRGHGSLKIDIHSGKNLTFYSFRHTHITMRLKAGTPLAIVAANTNTSMKYIEEHYYHYRSDESAEELALGREKRIKPSIAGVDWINQVEVEDYG